VKEWRMCTRLLLDSYIRILMIVILVSVTEWFQAEQIPVRGKHLDVLRPVGSCNCMFITLAFVLLSHFPCAYGHIS
jgi:hypothetical protein